MSETLPARYNGGRLRIRVGLIITIVGFLVFLLGADPTLFRLDKSPNIGMVQIFVFLCGLAVICVGGYISLASLWNGYQKTIAADIGLRLVSTGFVIAVGSGMADAFGFGSQKPPHVPYFGNWQSTGVLIGEGVIALGFLLMIPFRYGRPKSEE